jgi:hypothetical protein
MLRPIKTTVSRARLVAYSATTAASAANTVQVGKDEAVFTNATADNQLDVALRNPFHRGVVAVACAGASVADGGVARIITRSKTTLATTTVGGGNAADPGGVEVLALGFDSTLTTINANKLNMFDAVVSSFRQPMIIAGKVLSTGVKSIGGSTFTSVKNSTGNYTVTFPKGFGRNPTVVVTAVSGAEGYSALVSAKTNNTFTVKTFNPSDSAADCAFNFIAYGSTGTHEHRMDRGPVVEVGFRKPRLLALRIPYTAGAPAIDIGAGQATVADTAEGRATITYSEAFAREPIVLASCEGTDGSWATIHTTSSTGCLIEMAGSTGTLDDPTALHVIVLGSDDAAEY